MLKTYHGSCHCGAVRFEAELDLDQPTYRCNCSICRRTRFWPAVAREGGLRAAQRRAGADAVPVQPRKNQHYFCRHCGVRPFGIGTDTPIGRMYGVNLGCLEGVSEEELSRLNDHLCGRAERPVAGRTGLLQPPLTRMKTALPLPEVYALLEPGPVLLLSTAHRGQRNVMTHVLAFDAGVRAAAGGLRGQRPQPVAPAAARQRRMRAEHPHRRRSPTGGRLRQQPRHRTRQVQPLRAGHEPGAAGGRAAARRLLRQPGVQGRRHRHGAQVRLLRARGRRRLGRPESEESAHAAPPRLRALHGRRQDDPLPSKMR